MMSALALAAREIPLPQLSLEPDLFGRALWAYHHGCATEYYLRRDDNRLDRDSLARYFRSWEEMPAHQRCLLNHARGRVLDLGAGAGQHALELQQRGLTVTAVDASPLAVKLCQTRGIRDARVMNAQHLRFDDPPFDTVLLMSNNIGIAGTPEGLRQLLHDLAAITSPDAQILADIADYTATNDPSHLRYHVHNRSRSRYPGSIRLRLEYDGMCSPAFDWLLPKLADLKAACADTGWKIWRCVQVSGGAVYAIGIGRAG